MIKKTDIYYILEWFLRRWTFEGTFSYTTEFDPKVPNSMADFSGVPNKLTLIEGSSVDRFFLRDENYDPMLDPDL
jgi:hypothetical protein